MNAFVSSVRVAGMTAHKWLTRMLERVGWCSCSLLGSASGEAEDDDVRSGGNTGSVGLLTLRFGMCSSPRMDGKGMKKDSF